MPVVKHVSGPMAGTDTQIDPRTQRITFGRSLDCEIVYPPEFTEVGRKHFALERKPNGRWVVDLFGDFVAINGVPADPGTIVPPDALIELGRRGGTSFKFSPEAFTDNMLPTMAGEQDIGARGMASQARGRAELARKVAIGGIIVALIGAIAGGYSYWKVSPLEAAMIDHDKKLTKLAQETIGPEVRQQVERSAYLVVAKDPKGQLVGMGTAWPVRSTRGKRVLATNAHVAEIRDQLPQGFSLAVVAPAQGGTKGQIYDVVEHELHPGYRVFDQFGGRDAIRVPLVNGMSQPVRIGYGTYDVGLLTVSQDLPDNAMLDIADDTELKALAAGDPIGLAGYPQDSVDNSVTLVLGAVPKFQSGNVTALTDYFYLPAPFEQARFIHVGMAGSGGQSGSPVVNAKGHVVALFNLGSASQARINGAQRADLVRSLLERRADAEIERDRKYWDAQLARFKTGADDMVAEVLQQQKPTPNASPKEAQAWNGKMGSEHKTQIKETTVRRISQKMKLKPNGRYTFVLYGTNLTPVGLSLKVGDNIVGEQIGPRMPAITFPSAGASNSAEAEAELVIFTADTDMWYVLRAYEWQIPPGESPAPVGRIRPPGS
jgi:hypothetical protein